MVKKVPGDPGGRAPPEVQKKTVCVETFDLGGSVGRF